MARPDRDEIRSMLSDMVSNIDKPEHFEGSQEDWERDWLFTVADVSVDLAKERQPSPFITVDTARGPIEVDLRKIAIDPSQHPGGIKEE